MQRQSVGDADGATVGSDVGAGVGFCEGFRVGFDVGSRVGDGVESFDFLFDWNDIDESDIKKLVKSNQTVA